MVHDMDGVTGSIDKAAPATNSRERAGHRRWRIGATAAVRAVAVLLLVLGAALLVGGPVRAAAPAGASFTVNGTTGALTVQQGDALTLIISPGSDSGNFQYGVCPDATCSIGYVLGSGTLTPGEQQTFSVTADFPYIPAGQPVYPIFRLYDAGKDLIDGPLTVNHPPVFADGDSTTLTVDENGSKTISIPATDADGDLLDYRPGPQEPSQPVTIEYNSIDQTTTYYSAPGYYGPDQYQVAVDDSHGGSDVITINVTVVTKVEHAPVATNGSAYTTNEDTAASGQLSATDADTGDTLTYAAATQPANGSVTATSDGSFTYTPAPNFNGTDSFTFTANDGHADQRPGQRSASRSIAVDDAPVAADQRVSTDEDTALNGRVSATDVDNDPLTYAVVNQPQHNTLSFNADGSFTYIPDANFNGTDSFTFKANDGTLESNTATVSITVTAVNDPPVIVSAPPVTLAEDGSATITVTASDSDTPNLTFSTSLRTAHGTISGVTLPTPTVVPGDLHAEYQLQRAGQFLGVRL